jgi:hypothetical protein
VRRYPEKHRFGDEAARQGCMEERTGQKQSQRNRNGGLALGGALEGSWFLMSLNVAVETATHRA